MKHYEYKDVPLGRFYKHIIKTDSCWLWDGAKALFGWGNPWQTASPARIMFYIKYGALPKSKAVKHRCGNKHCVNPDHLYLGKTHDGIIGVGRKKNFSDEQLRELLDKGLPNKEIAKILGVSPSAVSHRKKIFNAPGATSHGAGGKTP